MIAKTEVTLAGIVTVEVAVIVCCKVVPVGGIAAPFIPLLAAG
jgi:hypothetical protein